MTSLKIIKGFELINGKVQFEICTGKEVSNLNEVLKKVIDYLLIFQFGEQQMIGDKRVVKVRRSGLRLKSASVA